MTPERPDFSQFGMARKPDRDDQFGFRRIEYEAIQHVPILREAWVVSLHGLVSTTSRKSDQSPV